MPYRLTYGATPNELQELISLLDEDFLIGASNIAPSQLQKIKLSALLDYLNANLDLPTNDVLSEVPIYNAILQKNPSFLWDFSDLPRVVDLARESKHISSASTSEGTCITSIINGIATSRRINNSYYLLPASTKRNLITDFSFEFVFKLASLAVSFNQGIMCQDYTAYPSFQYLFYIGGNASQRFLSFQNKKNNVTLSLTAPGQGYLQAQVSYHCVFTKEGSSLKIYMNGSLSSQRNDSPLTLDSYPPNQPAYLLSFPHALTTEKFDGDIAYFAIYDRALTSSEVQSHYQLALVT